MVHTVDLRRKTAGVKELLMAKKKNTKPAKAAQTEAEFPFEDAMKRIETIVLSLESGELRLGESLALYEEAVGQLKRCHQYLEDAERQVNVLAGVDDQGNPITESLDGDESEDLETKRAARSRKRGVSKRSRKPTTQDEDHDEDTLGGLF